MQSITVDIQTKFELFNLLQLPVALFSKIDKRLIFSNKSFDELYTFKSSINKKDAYKELEKRLIDELNCIYQGDAEFHTFNIEVDHARKKNIYEYNAYKNSEYIVVHVQDITKLKKTQYLLNSSSAMLEKYSNEMFMLAHTDQLTKTANRRALFTKFDELKNANTNLKCTISIIDIDHFKKFNDTYGHEFGDYVLESFCNHIKKMITPISFFSRIGGEEFCLIQDKSDIGESTVNIQQILESIKKMQLETPTERTANISFSAGVSEYGLDGTTLDVLLNNADKALYYAKQNGRSCVIPYSTELFEKRDDLLFVQNTARKIR
jgi:diguanylate cyclase (GGDEF)-like protein